MTEPTTKTPPRLRRRHPWRDTIEGLLSAAVLVLIIRHFAFEVFKIPTGSMAPTLLGQHRDVVCPNCGYRYMVDGVATAQGARCPNCWQAISGMELGSLHCSCFPSWPERLFWKGGNRVIVNKFLLHMRPVKRWDVIVFKWPYVIVRCKDCGYVRMFPQDSNLPEKCPNCGGPVAYERQNYIKRLVGLPGEELVVWHGDIYIHGCLQRKPPEVQEAVWQHVCDSKYVPAQPVRDANAVWQYVAGRGDADGVNGQPLARWKAEAGGFADEKGKLSLIPEADGIARVRYASPITDYAPYNQWPPSENVNTLNPVGDLRWSVDVRLDKPGQLRLGIEEDGRTYEARITINQDKASAALMAGKTEVAHCDFAAEVGKTVSLSFANADDRLELKAGGRTILSYDDDSPLSIADKRPPDALKIGDVITLSEDPFDKVGPNAVSNGAWLEVEGARAEFNRVRLQRDLYYLPRLGAAISPPTVEKVPDGCYFVMGDNTRSSYDSRAWGAFPAKNLIGTGAVVWWPLNQIRACR